MEFWKKHLPFFIYAWILNRIIRRIQKHAINRVQKHYWQDRKDYTAYIPALQLYAIFQAKPDFQWETMKNRILVPVEKQGRRVVFSISRDIKLRHAFFKSFDFVEVNLEDSVRNEDNIYYEMEEKVRSVTREKLRTAKFMKRNRVAAIGIVPVWNPHSNTHVVHTCKGDKEYFSLSTDRAVLSDTTPAEFQNLLETPNPKKIETRVHIVDAFYLTTDEQAIGDPKTVIEELRKESERCAAAAEREFEQLQKACGIDVPFFYLEALCSYCAATFFNPRKLTVVYGEGGTVGDVLVTGYDSLMNEVKEIPMGKLIGGVPGPLNGFVMAYLTKRVDPDPRCIAVNYVSNARSDRS